MVAPPEVLLVPRFIILLAGLLVPGGAWMRTLRVPVTLSNSFVGSAFALFVTVLALQLGNVAISFGTLGAGLLALTLLARIARRKSDATAGETSLLHRVRNYNPLTGMGGWTPIYFLFLAAALWRAWHEPLAGPDIEFRWGFLAEQMLRLGSLDFYPPRSSEDFFSYFWVETIPPGASALHAWAYACAGSSNAAWTIPSVFLQLWAVHDIVWRIAERIGGVPAARFACLAAAACPLLTWSILIGQETGLTAISLLGIVYAFTMWSAARTSGWAALAGIFAAVGAASREYGLVFPALAFTGLIVLRTDRRAWFAFLAASAVSLIWPLRSWILTGNPFYSLSFGDMFHVNERFVAWIEQEAGDLGTVLKTAAGWSDIARYVLLYAPLAVIGWMALVIATLRGRREAAFALVGTLVVLALWVMSIRYTNGGLFYSLRVTSPALAVGALAGGIALASVATSRPGRAGAINALVALAVVALLPATLALPHDPWHAPREWPAVKHRTPLPLGTTDETVNVILHALSRSTSSEARTAAVVLADGPGYQRRFLPTGIRVAPLWSPQADWLFDRQLAPAEASRRWQQSGVTHLIVSKWKPNLDFLNTRSRWTLPPFQVQLVGETKTTAVFAIRAIE